MKVRVAARKIASLLALLAGENISSFLYPPIDTSGGISNHFKKRTGKRLNNIITVGLAGLLYKDPILEQPFLEQMVNLQ